MITLEMLKAAQDPNKNHYLKEYLEIILQHTNSDWEKEARRHLTNRAIVAYLNDCLHELFNPNRKTSQWISESVNE